MLLVCATTIARLLPLADLADKYSKFNWSGIAALKQSIKSIITFLNTFESLQFFTLKFKIF
jgi:hypothetical protein